jgi:hypothetical protein
VPTIQHTQLKGKIIGLQEKLEAYKEGVLKNDLKFTGVSHIIS